MFHENLKSKRLFCGLSQQQVADYLNVTPQSISKWERGSALPSIEYLPKLAAILNCDINDFFKEKSCNNEIVSLLNDFFVLIIDLTYNRTKNTDHLVCFIRENPSITKRFSAFCQDLNRHQTISCDMLQNILSCSKQETMAFLGYMETCNMIEKLQGSPLYVVTPEAGGFFCHLLESYECYAVNGEAAKTWELLKTECPDLL